MSRFDLGTFQTDFAAALNASDPAARPTGLNGQAAARFRIYRNNVYHGLGEQLAEAYPVVRRLVGEAFFLATAREYLDEHPPRSRSLALFGGEFPAFLQGFQPAASLPYLADVARLERAWLEAMHAADAAPLAPAELGRQGPALAEASFAAHPAARIVTSGYPIVDLWRVNQPGADSGGHRFAVVGHGALITRPQAQVEVRELSPSQAAFARSLLSGDDVSTALECVGRFDDSFDVTTAFRELLAAGAFEQTRSLPD